MGNAARGEHPICGGMQRIEKERAEGICGGAILSALVFLVV